MTFFEEFGKKVLNIGETAAEKTKEVAGFAKMNVKILDVQNKLDKAYVEVGKKYLELHPANDEEGMEEVVNAVYALEDQLKELRKQLQELKGTAKCDVCGTECDKDDLFCKKCGAELKKEEVIIDTEEVAEEDFEVVVDDMEEETEVEETE